MEASRTQDNILVLVVSNLGEERVWERLDNLIILVLVI